MSSPAAFGHCTRKTQKRGKTLPSLANFAFAFGKPVTDAVRDLGTVSVYNSGYALLLPWFLGG